MTDNKNTIYNKPKKTLHKEEKARVFNGEMKTLMSEEEKPCYKDAPAYVNGVSEQLFKVGMCLPAGPYVTDEDVIYIVETIKSAIVR